MRYVKKTALVAHSAQKMFELVDDVDSYSEYLPWCTASSVIHRSEQLVKAQLELSKGNLNKSFTTLNKLVPGYSIQMELVDGPFSTLEGGWLFKEIGEEGCEVILDLRFAFESRLADLMFGSFFEETCGSLVEAFTQRANQIYLDG